MPALDRDGSAAGLELRAERARHDLGMIARLLRLLDGCDAFGLEPGEDNRRFHLRARDRRRVMNAFEIAAVDLERSAAFAALKPRAHLFQRLGDPFHRPAPKR